MNSGKINSTVARIVISGAAATRTPAAMNTRTLIRIRTLPVTCTLDRRRTWW
jgi:hypothetical protein